MSNQQTNIAVNGAAGRMGRRILAMAIEDPNVRIVDALEHDGHGDLGKDAGRIAGLGDIGILLTSGLSGSVQAVIDFSTPDGASDITAECVGNGVPLVMATTGLSDAVATQVRQAAETIPVVWAPNMSMAANVLMKLSEMTAQTLKKGDIDADVEILERHHRFKEDAPSGTALRFGELIAEKMGLTTQTHGREGTVGMRPRQEVGYHAIRVGDNPGEHTIVFGLIGETIELTVRASSRDCYALGAVAAAKFVATQPAGLYNMYDVLGL